MGKRKKDLSEDKIRRKIRRLEQKLRHLSSSSEEEEHQRYSRSRSPEPVPLSSQSEQSDVDYQIRSCVSSPAVPLNAPVNGTSELTQDPGPSTSDNMTSEALPSEILEALGDPTGKDEIFGPAINEEIAKRWGRVLVEGLTKEAKETTIKKTLFPENFCLSKAPKLNLEISAVLSDNVKHRDKLLEKAQNQLGLGIAGLTNLASLIIKEDLPKVEILKKLSDTSQIFLDLHFENTKHRRKLITTSLDKKFSTAISDVKRDAFLFGADLGAKIKATKTAERSGLQIKRNMINAPSSSRQQGNWRGPPRFPPNRAPKPGGQNPKYSTTNQGYKAQHGRRPPQPTMNRAPGTQKVDYRSRRNQ